MSNIAIFTFENQTVRTALKGDEPFFCLKDVTDILAIKVASPERFSLDEKGVHKMYTPTTSGKQQITFINEPNLYRVIFRSNKAEAVKFQNWVFDEVLPSIRKTGSYSQKSTAHQRQPLVTACDKLAVNQSLRSEVYTMVGKQFGVDDVASIPVHLLPEATAFVYELILVKQASERRPPTQYALSDKTLERLSNQFCQTSKLIEQIKKQYLPFLQTINGIKGEKLNALLTLLHYDVQDNVQDLLKFLPSDVRADKHHPITQNFEMAYYADIDSYNRYFLTTA